MRYTRWSCSLTSVHSRAPRISNPSPEGQNELQLYRSASNTLDQDCGPMHELLSPRASLPSPLPPRALRRSVRASLAYRMHVAHALACTRAGHAHRCAVTSHTARCETTACSPGVRLPLPDVGMAGPVGALKAGAGSSRGHCGVPVALLRGLESLVPTPRTDRPVG